MKGNVYITQLSGNLYTHEVTTIWNESDAGWQLGIWGDDHWYDRGFMDSMPMDSVDAQHSLDSGWITIDISDHVKSAVAGTDKGHGISIAGIVDAFTPDKTDEGMIHEYASSEYEIIELRPKVSVIVSSGNVANANSPSVQHTKGRVFYSEGKLNFQGFSNIKRVTIYDISGKVVETVNLSQNNRSLPIQATPGVYIVELKGEVILHREKVSVQ